ncbi:hypothetical protein CC78DRAFT_535667 [Lojkania enalia]|uniref:Uncharacterized protein n=1 Tax=Lojkania enalia TaxID=147567 RepID=A0A9P4N415_9PLEO|nr:hypothetical protein CC78DRAFT_535667 [Didymosphaeria enalia]
MMYTDDSVQMGNKPALKTPIVWLTMPNMTLPTVQLQNSDQLQSITCEAGTDGPKKINMQFKDKGAYEYAWNNWHNEVRPDGDYLVVTEAPGCWDGADAIQERRFLRAKTEERDDETLSITCDVESVPLSDAVDEDTLNDIEFGDFDPANDPSGLQVDSDAPGASPSENGTNTQIPLRDPSGDSSFDKILDYQIGQIDMETMNNNFKQYNFTLDDFFGDSDLPESATQNLRKRRIGDRLKKLAKKVVKKVKEVAKKVVEVVKKAGEAIVDFAKDVGEKLNDFFTFDRSFTKGVGFDTTNNAGFVETPFDGLRGIKLLEFEDPDAQANIQIFCVECGASGDFEIRGALKFSIGKGLEKAEIGIKGNMEAALQFGFAGSLSLETSVEKEKTKEFEKRIVTIPLSPFSIPGILVIGPSASLATGFDLTFEASGKLLAGAIATWGNIEAVLDLKDNDNNKAVGFVPDIQPVFEADGKLAISTGVFLSFKLAVGVDVLNGKFEASAGLVNKPRLAITASTEAEFGLNGTQFTGDCKGVEIELGFTHEVSVDFVLAKLEKSFTLTTFEGPTFDQCITIGPQRRSLPVWNKRAPSFPSPPSSLGNTTFDGGIYTSMGNPDGSVHIRYSPNGNVYAVPEAKVPTNVKEQEWSGWFASDESGTITLGDSLGRMFHGYLDTIQNDGVSRLRLHKPDELPKTAWPVVFSALLEPSENSTALAAQDPTLVLADPSDGIYVPILCIYEREGVYPKMFMANDTETGAATLMSNEPAIIAKVTGEKVKQCGTMPLTNWRTGQEVPEE